MLIHAIRGFPKSFPKVSAAYNISLLVNEYGGKNGLTQSRCAVFTFGAARGCLECLVSAET